MTSPINQSLAHGLDILLLYDTTSPVYSVFEISQKLGYSQSKAYRLVRTLIKYGFLTESNGSAKYALGFNALRLGLLAQQRFNITEISRPFMKELCSQTKETVLLTTVVDTKGIVLERVESEEPVRYSLFQPGAYLPLHGGASSKIMMAFLPEQEWDRVIAQEGLRRYTQNTITDPDRLKSHLREVKKKGYAFSDQEIDRDVRAVAAPVLNERGELIAGLSIAGPVYRINKKRVNLFKKLVVACARNISSNLGYGQNATARGGSK